MGVDDFRRLISLAADVAGHFYLYSQKLELSGFSGTEPHVSTEIVGLLGSVRGDTKTTTAVEKLASGDVTASVLFEALGGVNRIVGQLGRVYSLFYHHQVDPFRSGDTTSSGSTISSGYVTDISEQFQRASHMYDHLRGMAELVVDAGLPVSVIATEAEVLAWQGEWARWRKSGDGQYVAQLYAALLQEAINQSEGSTPALTKLVVKLVEENKTEILAHRSEHYSGIANRSCNSVQRLVALYNLVPVAAPCPLADVIASLGAKGQPEAAAKLLSTGGRKIGFIMIRKVTARPLEHQSWLLTDRDRAELDGALPATTAGINAAWLKRTATIIPREPTGKSGDSVEFIDADTADGLYVLETIDGNNWRVLTPWPEQYRQPVPAAWLAPLTKVTGAPSQRLEAYNDYLNSAIWSHLGVPIWEPERSSGEAARKEDTYWNNLRNRIRSRVIDGLNAGFGNTVPSLGTVESRLTHTRTVSAILEAVAEEALIEKDYRVSAEVQALARQEINLSYIKDLDRLSRALRGDLEEALREHRDRLSAALKSGGMSGPGQDAYRRNQVLNAIGTMLSDVMAKHITRRSNICLSVQNKMEILERTLLKSVI